MFQGGTSELCRVLGKARHFQGLFCDLILSLQSSWYSRLPALGYAKQRLGTETDICPLALELSNSFCIMFASPACRGPQGVTQSPWPVPLRKRLYRASLLPPALTGPSLPSLERLPHLPPRKAPTGPGGLGFAEVLVALPGHSLSSPILS